MTSEGHADSDHAYDHPGMLLPYSRQRPGVSHASPRRDTRFTEALTVAPHLVLVPTFRSIGDSLFVLAFLEAFAAYRRLDHNSPPRSSYPRRPETCSHTSPFRRASSSTGSMTSTSTVTA